MFLIKTTALICDQLKLT